MKRFGIVVVYYWLQEAEKSMSKENKYNDPLYRANRPIVLDRDNYTCTYCGNPNANTVDHVLAIENGGTHDLWNLVAACINCNSSKQDRTQIRLPWVNRKYFPEGITVWAK